jgi:integrase
MIKYYRDGRAIYESAGTDIKDDAKTILRQREGALADGRPIPGKAARLLRFDDAVKDLLNDYRVNGKRSHTVVKRRAEKHLTPFFGGRRLAEISTVDIRAYVAHRKEQGIVKRGARVRDVSNAEINRELQHLKRAFTLAIQAGKLSQKPHIPLLKESSPRAGFFEREQFESVVSKLPDALRPIIRFAYITGWRVPSEVQTLAWSQVDFRADTVRLNPGTTKNDEGRVFPMTRELRTLLERQRDVADDAKRAGHIVPWVFFRMVAKGRRGPKAPKRIIAFTKAWKSACVAAGCPGRIPHDFRRTAVRNLVRAGVPERVAMQMTGHKTRSVFERYNIVSEGDLFDAAKKLDAATETVTSIAAKTGVR